MKNEAELKKEFVAAAVEEAIENFEHYMRDYRHGYEDRQNHVYDKWYRYNRRDNGKAYDAGSTAYVLEDHSDKWIEEDQENFNLIECIH